MTDNNQLSDDLITCINRQGWYCPRCDTMHPINMCCLPEQLIWDSKITDYYPIGQKLTYYH